jgi:arylsulfatase A-like enzyme
MIGKIIKTAEEKFGDNLLIIFTADHGEMLGNHKLWGKHNCAYDEVWHIPLFVRFPHGEKSGIKCSNLVNTCDILPTCLEAAGGKTIPCDGVSLYHPSEREYTFAEGEGYIAVTDGRYKYVHVQKGNEQSREFLDCVTDPCEFENRITDSSSFEQISRLREKIIEHFMKKVLP